MVKFTEDMGAKVTTSFLNYFKLKAMKSKYLFLLGTIAFLASCTSAYKTGQTPDDVYYSPAPPQIETYVTSDNQQDRNSYGYNNQSGLEDLSIRRGINDPRYRSNLSLNLGYGYNPYDSYGSSFYSPYSSYYSPFSTSLTFYPYNYNSYGSYYSPYYNNYYSPYYNSYYTPVYYSEKSSNYNSNYRGPRQVNLGAYNNTNSTNGNAQPLQPASNSMPVRSFKPQPANQTGVGGFIRRVFTPSNTTTTRSSDNQNNSNNNNNTAPVRTMQSNTSTNSSSSGSSGSAPVRTFRR